jgi:hypothetical protein
MEVDSGGGAMEVDSGSGAMLGVKEFWRRWRRTPACDELGRAIGSAKVVVGAAPYRISGGTDWETSRASGSTAKLVMGMSVAE